MTIPATPQPATSAAYRDALLEEADRKSTRLNSSHNA